MRIPLYLVVFGAAAILGAATSNISSSEPKDFLSVRKTDRILDVYQKGERIGSYPIALGKDCPDRRPKMSWADSCTGEGDYKVAMKFPSKGALHGAAILDYPHAGELASGLMQGRVGLWNAFYYARSRVANGFVRNPSDTDLSFSETELGSLFIHGDRMRESGKDWTPSGSIALDSEALDTIFSLIEKGTLVKITR